MHLALKILTEVKNGTELFCNSSSTSVVTVHSGADICAFKFITGALKNQYFSYISIMLFKESCHVTEIPALVGHLACSVLGGRAGGMS